MNKDGEQAYVEWLCIYNLSQNDQNPLLFFFFTFDLFVPLAAVQNERQPRSTAHVSLDSICVDTKKEHLATTRDLTSSATYSSVICRPLVTSSVTTPAATQPCSNTSNNHRFMVSLLTAETCAKLEPEDGEIMLKKFNSGASGFKIVLKVHYD